MWTQFWDMHSGGGCKEKWSQIFIEAKKEDAVKIFYSIFKHNPYRVSCTCCGADYRVNEYETLAEATAFQRKERNWTVAQFCALNWVRVISQIEIPSDWNV